MKKNRKGFTLIELLAVIVILAVIALIATPLIMNVINDAKKGAARDAGYNVIKAGELKAATEGIAGGNPPFHYDENSNLDMKGTKPSKFILDINKDMDTQLKAWLNGYCVIKNYGNETVTIDESKKSEADCVSGGSSNPRSFATDSWETIANAVKEGNTDVYNIGDTKEVTLTGEYAGTYTLRLANKSTPTECNGADFSQSACGFVVEFVDIITVETMNPSGSCKGGWPAMSLYTIVNTDIYNSLPSDLKKYVKTTKVVSGHGDQDTENFTSNDHLYLLSTKEIWGKDGISNTVNYDTAEAETRQLDYYKSKGVTTDNPSGAIKKYS